MRNTADVTGGKPIAVLLQSISGVSAFNPLVAFYDIHGGKREVLFFYFVPDTTRYSYNTHKIEEKQFGINLVSMLTTPSAPTTRPSCFSKNINKVNKTSYGVLNLGRQFH
jgi:hypothetical protein